MAARISLRVKSGCLATRFKSHSECSSSGEVLPPLGLASTLPVSLQRRHHRITELTPTSNTWRPPAATLRFQRFNRTLTQVRGIRLRHRSSSQANQFLQLRLGKGSWESP